MPMGRQDDTARNAQRRLERFLDCIARLVAKRWVHANRRTKQQQVECDSALIRAGRTSQFRSDDGSSPQGPGAESGSG